MAESVSHWHSITRQIKQIKHWGIEKTLARKKFVTLTSHELLIRLTSGWMHSNSTRVVHAVGRVSGEKMTEIVKWERDYFGSVSQTVAELQFHRRPK